MKVHVAFRGGVWIAITCAACGDEIRACASRATAAGFAVRNQSAIGKTD